MFMLGFTVSWVNAASACPFQVSAEQNFTTKGLLGTRWTNVVAFLTLDFRPRLDLILLLSTEKYFFGQLNL